MGFTNEGLILSKGTKGKKSCLHGRSYAPKHGGQAVMPPNMAGELLLHFALISKWSDKV